MLKNSNTVRPYDSTYQGVKLVKSQYDKDLYETKDYVVVTMGLFHTLYLFIRYDESSNEI